MCIFDHHVTGMQDLCNAVWKVSKMKFGLEMTHGSRASELSYIY